MQFEGNQEPWTGCNRKCKEAQAMGEKLSEFFGLMLSIIGLKKFSV